jgi:hypothetical protein
MIRWPGTAPLRDNDVRRTIADETGRRQSVQIFKLRRSGDSVLSPQRGIGWFFQPREASRRHLWLHSDQFARRQKRQQQHG